VAFERGTATQKRIAKKNVLSPTTTLRGEGEEQKETRQKPFAEENGSAARGGEKNGVEP